MLIVVDITSNGHLSKLGNFFRKSVTTIPPTVNNENAIDSSHSSCSSADMENAEKPEEDVIMDFESGIDTWIIDKDDSVASFSCLEKSRREGKGEKNMNKENIKHSAPSSDGKSLRSFRIRKRVSYQEMSSESESESNKILDEENYVFCSKRRSDPSTFSKSYTSLSTSKEIKRDIESLSSEEISSMLSEIDDSKDSSPGSNRERLHSIENVSSTTDSKTDSQSSCDVKCGKCYKISEGCNCGLRETKLMYDSHKNKTYKNSLKRNHNIENVSSPTINKVRDNTSTVSENKPEVHCSRCCKTLEFCNCDLTKVELIDKGQNNKFKQLFKRNGLSNRVIPQAGVNGKIASDNETGLKTKPAKHVTADNETLKCDICGYLSAELLIYKSHQILFHSEKSGLECEYCDFKTNQCASLATHIRVHFRMDCPYCDYHCSLKSSLETHLLRYHQNAHPYSCKVCDYSCKSQSKFYDHLQMHALKKYQCDECRKFFSSKPSLKTHIQKHLAKTNVFKCGQCNLQFSLKQTLKLHMKCHNKQSATYVCSSCKTPFSKKCDFISHSRTHMVATKTSKIKCEKCESTFSQGNHLKLHMRVHAIKFTKCKYCTFQCSDSNEIKNHICVPVNKLYNVQKRSLNFDGVVKDVKGKNTKTDTNFKEEFPVKKILKIKKNILTKNLPIPSETKVLSSKSNDLKNHKKTRPKVLAVRQNLRSFKSENKNERKNGNLKTKLKNSVEKRGRPKKPTNNKGIHTRIRKNGVFCDSSSIPRPESNVKRQRKTMKVRKDQLSKGMEVINSFFRKRQTLKEMLVEPITFANSSFIECYYQSQQPSSAATLHQHEERHLRRPSLLSCRYCSYKTNSQQLLKWHVDKNHTWDPVVVSKLFRP